MSLLTKRVTIASVTVIFIALFLGLKTTTRTEYYAPMAWSWHTLSFYGVRIMTDGGLLAPLITMAKVGHYKYWLCGLTFLTGAALFWGTRTKPLAKLFNISFYIFLALAMAFTLFACATTVLDSSWDSFIWDILFFNSYICFVIVFLPAVIFKILSIYCRHKAI